MLSLITTSSLLVLLLPLLAFGFNSPSLLTCKTRKATLLYVSQQTAEEDELSSQRNSRRQCFQALLAAGCTFLAPSPNDNSNNRAWAEEGSSRSIAPCKKNASGGVTNCISTGSVRQLDLYAPPWTFETSADEAAARIKGVIASDNNLELLEEDGPFFRVKASRGFNTDTLEFLVNAQDKVVTFRAEQDGEPSVPDFGAIRKQLDSIRQRATFGLMGQGVTADTAPSGNGPLGQLKAFYGLQSGQGFEEVFDE